MPKPSAVIFAKNVEAVSKFYEQLMAASIVHADEDHVVLGTQAMQLVIHAIPAHISATFEIENPPQLREGTPIKLCLPVSSIADARALALKFGGGLKPEEAQWQGRGFRACDGFDPEGNVVQFREDAP